MDVRGTLGGLTIQPTGRERARGDAAFWGCSTGFTSLIILRPFMNLLQPSQRKTEGSADIERDATPIFRAFVRDSMTPEAAPAAGGNRRAALDAREPVLLDPQHDLTLVFFFFGGRST